QPERGTSHLGRSRWRNDLQDGGSRNSASCSTFFRREITVELAEQSVAVFFSPVGQMNYKRFDLLTLRFTQSFDSAIIRGIRLHQVGICWCWRMIWQRRSRTFGPP